MLNVHHLRIFHTVAACESYSRAAERLGISQPAVSMQVRKLEEAVGVPLVVQRGRQVALTEAGEILAAYASRIFRLSDEATQAMEDFRELRRGRLRLAASSTPGAYVLPGQVARFRTAYPGVEVTLLIGNTRSAVRMVAEGAADLAVVGDALPEAFDVEMEPLCTDCLYVVVGPDHHWAARRSLSLDEFVATPLILREEGSSTRDVLDKRLGALDRTPRIAMELGSTEAVKEAVAAGLGPAVLSGWACRVDLQWARMVRVEVEGLRLDRTLHLCLPRGGANDLLATLFLKALRESDLRGGCLLPC